MERRGALRRYDFEQKTSVTVHSFDVFDELEYGLTGLAFDPDFATNHWLYIHRTVPEGEVCKKAGALSRSRISRSSTATSDTDTANRARIA